MSKNEEKRESQVGKQAQSQNSYYKNKTPNGEPKTQIGDSGRGNQSRKTINRAYDELKGLSSDELMGRLSNEIQQQKMNGTFDYDGLIRSLEQIKIYLPTQTYENMLRIIDSLK